MNMIGLMFCSDETEKEERGKTPQGAEGEQTERRVGRVKCKYGGDCEKKAPRVRERETVQRQQTAQPPWPHSYVLGSPGGGRGCPLSLAHSRDFSFANKISLFVVLN